MHVIEKMKNERDLHGLLEILEKGDIYRKLKAAEALGSIGDVAVPYLLEAMKNENPNIRWRAAIGLGKVGQPAVDGLIGILDGDDPHARVAATWAVSEIGDYRAINPLMRILQGNDSECCRVMAAAALLKMNDPASVVRVHEVCDEAGEEFTGAVEEAFHGT